MALDDVYQVQIAVTTTDYTNYLNLHYKQATAGDPPDDGNNLADTVILRLITPLAAMLTVGVKVQCVIVRRILSGLIKAPDVPVFRYLAATNGSRAGLQLPANSPFIIRLQSSLTAVKRNGRIYVSGVSMSDVTDGNLDAAYLSGPVQAFVDELGYMASGAPDTADYVLGILRRVNNGLPLDPPEFYQTDNETAMPIIYTQKKRRSERTSYTQ